jgi:hypothetical protein
MNFMQFSRLSLLATLFFGIFSVTNAQTNHPFSWKVTTDSWYKPQAYTFKYTTGDLTEKGGQPTIQTRISRGPVCSNECKNTTAPDVCTENHLKEKLNKVELSGFRLPAGYSGVEYVTFDVQSNGKTSGFQVVKQDVLCKPCIQEAVNLVADLGEWYPAVQDGIYVKSTVVVPVFFK